MSTVHDHMRVRELLRSHSSPPHDISSTISTLSQELEDYTEKITELKDELSRLESHHAALKEYHRDCCGLLAPVRRLPPEVLIDIFSRCRRFTPEHSRSQVVDSIGILAQIRLQRMAHVCARWYNVAMDTPSLWDTIFLHASALSGTPQQTETAMGLLRQALQRSGSLLLNVRMEGFGTQHLMGLEMIASHSSRWKTARLSHSGSVGYLSGIKGRLPLLTALELDRIRPERLDFLESIPSLKALTVHGSTQSGMSKLPLEALDTFEFVELLLDEVASAVVSMARLSHPCAVRLDVMVDEWNASHSSLGLQIPQTSSNISSLVLEATTWSFRPQNCLQTFDQILASLTLPSLCDLSFTVSDKWVVLPWPHQQFLALCDRSSFHTHLHSLQLSCVRITDAELIECLPVVPMLQRLIMSDPTMTNTLLSALTRTPNDSAACLVPHLRVIECESSLQFDDDVFLGFVASRCEPLPPNSMRFAIRIHTTSLRPLKRSVVARIEQMRARSILMFELSIGQWFGSKLVPLPWPME
ncbi:hypothetical protein DFH08DRAFT_938786 [Mycena albidolilacea]|uniref:F-box domain-containing protein n=1 Tax=Mycena albidolilacea TaxID=1033008 RepID=A0AAD6ZUZ3_9AGAR|nr:hypothetical protein DFH08DRAFT_938786 [Mycena albidolilacea]